MVQVLDVKLHKLVNGLDKMLLNLRFMMLLNLVLNLDLKHFTMVLLKYKLIMMHLKQLETLHLKLEYKLIPELQNSSCDASNM